MEKGKVIGWVKGNREGRRHSVRDGKSANGNMFAILNDAVATAAVYYGASIYTPGGKLVATVRPNSYLIQSVGF